MYVFAKTMALFWTAAEGILLVMMRWGYLTASRGDGRQKKFTVAFTAALGALCLVLFFGEYLLGRVLDLDNTLNRTLYRWALWNSFCTLWVILEGCIMVYVCRLYRILRKGGGGRPVALTGDSGKEDRASQTKWGIPLLVLGFLTLFLLYEAALFHVLGHAGLSLRGVVRISLFYIRICGIFWILFEGVVAIQGLRAYGILKRMNPAHPAPGKNRVPMGEWADGAN